MSWKEEKIKNIDQEIDKLLKELSEIEQNSNTTMTRDRIISMISHLTDIREKIYKAGGNIG